MSHVFRIVSGFLAKRPMILYHQPTWRCDCKCEFCATSEMDFSSESELGPAEVNQILSKAYAAGFTTYSVWGGEPLYYPGIAEIVRHADAKGMQVVLCTNGSRLEEYAECLAANSYYILLSLDAVGELHDRQRRHPGLFQKAVAGARKMKALGGKSRIILWSNLSRQNRGQIEELARLAKELDAFVEFFPASQFLGCREELLLSGAEREAAFQEVIDLKRRGYPITNTNYALRLMQTSEKFVCHLPSVGVHLLWDGSLWPCMPKLFQGVAGYGDARVLDFKRLGASPEFRANTRKFGACNNCLMPCVGHHANNLWTQAGRRFFNQLYYRNLYSFR